MAEERTELGRRLDEARMQEVMSWAELAQKAGMSVQALRDIRTGATARPRAATLRKLETVLGLAEGELVAGLPTGPAGPQIQVEVFHETPAEGRYSAIAVIVKPTTVTYDRTRLARLLQQVADDFIDAISAD